MFDIQGPAIVTGAASGLGQAVCLALVAHGISVTGLDRQPGPAADRLEYSLCDVTSPEQVQLALDAAKQRWGPPRIVVNCAGIGRSARVLGRNGVHEFALFEQVIRVNLLGTFNVLRLAVEQMHQLPVMATGDRGIVVNTASIAAFDGQVGQAAYAASKAGVVGMTLPLARELGKYGIRVVTLCPGVFHTPMVDAHVSDAVLDGLLTNAAWPRRAGEPGEFADMVLAVVRNRMLNGESIRLDGGLRRPAI